MHAHEPRKIDFSKITIDSSTGEYIEVPFELKAKDFLDFATEDLKGESMRDTVNALGNIKRSIDCLFDSLLFAANFLEDSKRDRWTFPEKMTFLGEIGIITPYILKKINSSRNLLEHEFKRPDRKEVEVAYDVAILLHYATVRYTKNFISELELCKEHETDFLMMEVEREKRKMKIRYVGEDISISWDKNPEDYKKWLHVLYQAQYQCV